MVDRSLHQRIDEALESINQMSKNFSGGTLDFGKSKEVKVARVQAIALARSHYNSE